MRRLVTAAGFSAVLLLGAAGCSTSLPDAETQTRASTSASALPSLPGKPGDVELSTQLIIQSGIADRMLKTRYQPQLPHGNPKGCKFWVEVTNFRGREYVGVVIQYPPNGYLQSFAAVAGKPFGVAGDPPLTHDQMDVVDRLASQWRKEHPQPSPSPS